MRELTGDLLVRISMGTRTICLGGPGTEKSKPHIWQSWKWRSGSQEMSHHPLEPTHMKREQGIRRLESNGQRLTTLLVLREKGPGVRGFQLPIQQHQCHSPAPVANTDLQGPPTTVFVAFNYNVWRSVRSVGAIPITFVYGYTFFVFFCSQSLSSTPESPGDFTGRVSPQVGIGTNSAQSTHQSGLRVIFTAFVSAKIPRM